MPTQEEHEAARDLNEAERLRFRKEAHKNGRWDEAHFGVATKVPQRPAPRPSRSWPVVRSLAALGIIVCAGLFTADWLGALDMGIRAKMRPDTAMTVLGDQQERAAAAIEKALGDSPYGSPAGDQEALRAAMAAVASEREFEPAAPAQVAPRAVMVGSPVSKPAPAALTAAQMAARQRGIDHLTKQRPAAVGEVDRFLAVIKRAETPGPDGLTYEERLLRDRAAAHAHANLSSEKLRLDLAWERYVDGKMENAKRLAHARDVLASLDKRISEERTK